MRLSIAHAKVGGTSYLERETDMINMKVARTLASEAHQRVMAIVLQDKVTQEEIDETAIRELVIMFQLGYQARKEEETDD